MDEQIIGAEAQGPSEEEMEEQVEIIKQALEVTVLGAKAKGLKLFREPETIGFQFVEEGGKESVSSNGANTLVAFCMMPIMQMGDAGLFNWAISFLGENEDVVIFE